MEAASENRPLGTTRHWLGVCVVIVIGVAMAMVGRLDQGKRVSIGLALAGAVGVGAAIYLCCRHGSEKKGRKPPAKPDVIQESTSPGVEEVEKVTAAVTSQVCSAPPKREEDTEQVTQDTEQVTQDTEQVTQDTEQITQDLEQVTRETEQVTQDLQELVHDKDHFAPSENGSSTTNGLETKEENDIVVVQRKDQSAYPPCDTPPSLSDSPLHDWKPDPVVLPVQTDESISFDGSIITQDKIDSLESKPDHKKESDTSFDGSIISKDEIEDCGATQEVSDRPAEDSTQQTQSSVGDGDCPQQIEQITQDTPLIQKEDITSLQSTPKPDQTDGASHSVSKPTVSDIESLIIPKPEQEKADVEPAMSDKKSEEPVQSETVIETQQDSVQVNGIDHVSDQQTTTQDKIKNEDSTQVTSPDEDSGFLGSPTSPEGVGMASPEHSYKPDGQTQVDTTQSTDGQGQIDITQSTDGQSPIDITQSTDGQSPIDITQSTDGQSPIDITQSTDGQIDITQSTDGQIPVDITQSTEKPDVSTDQPISDISFDGCIITQDQIDDIPKIESSSESEQEDEDQDKEHCNDIWVSIPHVDGEDIEFGIKVKSTPLEDQRQHDLVDVEEDSLAARVGLKAGDSLVRVNGMGVRRWSHDVLLEQFRLVPMEDIELTVQRKDGDKRYFKELKATLTQTDHEGIAVSSQEFDVNESSLSDDRDMIIANYSGTDRKRRCQIQAIGTDLFFVQAKGHQLKAGRVEDGEEQQFTFRREMFNCIDKCPESPYFQQAIYVFVFRAGSKGTQQGYITALSRTKVGLQHKERLHSRIHALSRADSRFFIHHFSASGFDCFESTQLPGHYLARDGDRMYLQYVSSDKERDACSNIHFRINYL